MKHQTRLSSIHLQISLKLLILLLHARNGAGDVPEEFYKSCSTSFNCGSTVSGIRYPFRDIYDPPYCGHPNFVLTCDFDEQVTKIKIMNTTFRVLEIHQNTQIMRLVREDVMVENCPYEMVDTALDDHLFEMAPAYTNYTFLYGCPAWKYTGFSHITCWSGGYDGSYGDVYLLPWSRIPGRCNQTVVVPGKLGGSYGAGEYKNSSENVEIVQQGFEIRWKINGESCRKCGESGGKCGFNPDNNEEACICAEPPYLADTCSKLQANRSSSTVKPFPGKDSWNKAGLSIGLGVGGAVVAVVAFVCLIFFLRRRNKNKVASKSVQDSSQLGVTGSTNFIKSIPTSKSDVGRGSSYFGVHVFNYAELEDATHNFDPSRELGDGGFGTVYYGVLPDGRAVAVKRLYENNMRRVEQFMNEVEILTGLRHKNLVTLYGCTSKTSQNLMLVYEYISNGTVGDHLHGKRAKSGSLSWSVRLNIAIETADALAYLHRSDIIHRDVKTNNVLLDQDFHVKVADFGLSRLFPSDATHVSTAPQGTPGYVDPEYYQCYQLTEKSDVYSFGVVLVELVSSLHAVDTNRHRHNINLSNMAIEKIQNRMVHELVDPNLGFETSGAVRRMITLVAELAFQCLQQERDMRPSMEDVLEALKVIRNDDSNALTVDVVNVGVQV